MEKINIPHPEEQPLKLTIDVGACRLTLKKGSSEAFVSGTYNDPTGERPCLQETAGGSVRIWQKSIFAFKGYSGGSNIPEFLLEISDKVPFELEFKSSASEAFVDLGGLPVTKTVFRYNAGKATLVFSKPNPVAMDVLDFSGNAGDLTIDSIANSNASRVAVEGSAAGFRLNFAGELKSDMKVSVSSSVSGIKIEIPRRANALIRQSSMLGGASYNGDFRDTRNGLETASYDPNLPSIEIDSKITLGGIEVRMVS